MAEKSGGFQNSDPLGRFFRDRLEWSALEFGLATLLANLAIDLFGAWRFDALLTRSGQPGLLQDVTSMFVDFIMLPVISGYYIWSIRGTRSLLEQLRTSRILTDSARFDRTAQELASRLRSKVALGACLTVSLLLTLLWVGNYMGWIRWGANVGWLLHASILPLLRAPMWFLGLYALCFVLFNVTATIVALRDLFEDQAVELSPWHPDRCGGLRGISQYTLTLSYAIAVVGISLSIMVIEGIRGGTLATSTFTWLAIAAYLILAPLVFFLPLGTAHVAMRRAKDKHLLLLAERFDAEYGLATRQIDEGTAVKSSVEKMEELRKLYKITEEFPVWPFDVANLRRFLAVITAPLAPGLVSLALDLLIKFLGSS